MHWLFQARKRFGLTILNYAATLNHVHLLVHENEDPDAVPQAMQLVAGRLAQEYNQRKNRRGAFWEDRYHATAVEEGAHLARCLVYIDLNMVRAGIVAHPEEWPFGGYSEVRRAPRRYRLIDRDALSSLLGLSGDRELASYQKARVEEKLADGVGSREGMWSEALAVGSQDFVDRVKSGLGIAGRFRDSANDGGIFSLREAAAAYSSDSGGKMAVLSGENGHFWRLTH